MNNSTDFPSLTMPGETVLEWPAMLRLLKVEQKNTDDPPYRH